MGKLLKLLGLSLFLLGLLLAVTYHKPNCSEMACPVAFPTLQLSSHSIENGGSVYAYVLAFEGNCSGKALETISENGHVLFRRVGWIYRADRLRPFGVFYVPGCRGNLTVYTVNTYFSNVSVPNVTYDGQSFLFLSPYTLRFENFYIDARGWLAYNVSGLLTIFPKEASVGPRELNATYMNGTLRIGDVLYREPIEGVRIEKGVKLTYLAVYDNPGGYFRFKNCSEHYNDIVRACEVSTSPSFQLPLAISLMPLGLGLFWCGVKKL